MSPAEDRPPEPPPEGVRSTPGPPSEESGPVPVRDLMKQMSAPAHEAPAAPAPSSPPADRPFEREGERWIARPAGEGAYGTGRAGAARLMAVHFFRAAEAGTPLREALIPARAFEDMAEEELRALCARATPIELDR